MAGGEIIKFNLSVFKKKVEVFEKGIAETCVLMISRLFPGAFAIG